MIKYVFLFFTILFIDTLSFGQEIFELDPSQSMLMTGKGPGQDAVINPYEGEDCIAIIDNIGENEFSIRIQSKGKIIEIIPIQPSTTKKVDLSNGYELYLDTEFNGKAKVKIEKKKD